MLRLSWNNFVIGERITLGFGNEIVGLSRRSVDYEIDVGISKWNREYIVTITCIIVDVNE